PNPPWADSPPQLTLRLQRALHTHFTPRPPLIQYYDSVMPPAYQDHRLFTNLLHFCSSYFPPSLCEITGKVWHFYLNELCPYLIRLEPQIAVLPLSQSDFKTLKARWTVYGNHYSLEFKHTQRIKEDLMLILESLNTRNKYSYLSSEISPMERYIRGLLMPE